MAIFPAKVYQSASAYFAGYRQAMAEAWETVDPAAFERGAAMIGEAIRGRRVIYACGNGGSAAISGHLMCDFLKGIQTNTALRPRVVSLASHLELITAIANDINYAEVFAFQLKTMAEPGDVLITISSSGNSENIVRAIDWSRQNGVGTIAMTGFAGGRSSKLADDQPPRRSGELRHRRGHPPIDDARLRAVFAAERDGAKRRSSADPF